MHRIDGPGATEDNRFTDGNPASGIPPTIVTDDWANAVQEEIVAVITAAGLTLNKAYNGQLKDAIEALIVGAVPMASTAESGLVELATSAEAVAGVDAERAVTPAGLSAALANALMPVGTIIDVAGKVAPTGFLKCNGSPVSRTTYASLFAKLVTDLGFTSQTFTVSLASPAVCTKASHGFTGGERLRLSTTGALPTGLSTSADYFVEVINANTFYLLSAEGGSRVNTSGTQSGTHSYTQSLYGLGDGATTFNVPDLRGEFRRGWDDGRGVDAGRGAGTWQADEFKQHNHNDGFNADNTMGVKTADLAGSTYSIVVDNPVTPYDIRRGGAETRPRNRALLACIKY